jgi:integrase
VADRTKSDYRGHRKHIDAEWANAPIVIVADKRIRRYFKRRQADLLTKLGARQTDLVMATLSRILSFAADAAIIEQNHMLGIEKAYRSDRSDAIWTIEDVEACMKVANRPMKLALIMALHLGRREGDLIRISWGDYDGERIAVTNRKGGRKIRFKARCTATLCATLDAAKLALGRIPHKDELILTTITGQLWVESHFSTKFSAAKNRAGLSHLHSMTCAAQRLLSCRERLHEFGDRLHHRPFDETHREDHRHPYGQDAPTKR